MLINGKIAADRGEMIISKAKAKAKKPSVKVVVVVANNGRAKTGVIDYMADDFILKPISVKSLTNRVITQLARR